MAKDRDLRGPVASALKGQLPVRGGGGGKGHGFRSVSRSSEGGSRWGGGGGHPQYANNSWAPLTRKRHIPPHPAQPQHTNDWAPRTRKRHQQEHRPQWPTERSDPTQHAKGRRGHCPGPRKGTTTRRNVTRGVVRPPPPPPEGGARGRLAKRLRLQSLCNWGPWSGCPVRSRMCTMCASSVCLSVARVHFPLYQAPDAILQLAQFLEFVGIGDPTLSPQMQPKTLTARTALYDSLLEASVCPCDSCHT